MKKGWQTTTLGDVAEISAGNSAPQAESLFKDGTYPFFRTADAGRVRFGDIYESADYLNEEGVRRLRRYPKGTILFPKSGASTFLNHRVMLGVEGCVSSHLATIVADESQIKPRYLLYFLSTVAAQDLVQDHAYPSLNLPIIAGISIQAPTLPEQQRIVGILDEAFDGIATAKANAEKNLQNARALFEGHLQSVFTRRGEGWVEKTIEEVCIIGDGNHASNYPRKDELVEAGVPFIRATNLVAGRISGYDMRFLSPQKHAQLKKGHLKTGDILITNRGEIGRTAIVDSDYDNANLNSQIAWLRCCAGMDNKFLFHVLNSGDIQKHFQSSKSGAALQQFTIKQLKALRVPLPPAPAQQAIVEQLDALSEETQRLKSIYQRKLAALEALKKSLLHQAFTGNL